MSSVLTDSKLRNFVKKLIIVDVSLRHPKRDQKFDHLYKLMVKMQEINGMKLGNKDEVINELKSIEDNDHVINFLLLNLVKTKDNFTFDNLSLKHLQESWISLKSQWDSLKTNNFKPWEGETLFLKGEYSEYIKLADEEEIMRFFPNSKIETISKSGHWPHFDNQVEFINKLISFL